MMKDKIMEKINKKNKIPLYIQIQKIIKTRIENNIYQKGTLIPSENELSKEFGVTRFTIRNAMKGLQKEDLIYTEKGKGSLVKKKFNNGIMAMNYFMKRVNNTNIANCELKFKIKSQKKIICEEEIRKSLKLDISEKAYEIVKVIFCKDIPEIVEMSYIPVDKIPELLNKNIEKISINKIFENKYNKKINHVRENIQPAVSDIKTSKLLGIKENSPVFLTKRITKSKEEILEFKRIIARGDRYILKSEFIYNSNYYIYF